MTIIISFLEEANVEELGYASRTFKWMGGCVGEGLGQHVSWVSKLAPWYDLKLL